MKNFIERNPTLTIFLAYVVGLLLFAVAVTTTGCNTEKRAWRNMQRAERIDNTVPPKYCADKFPAIEKYKEVIKYKPGVPIKGDTKYVTANCDSLKKARDAKESAAGAQTKDNNTFRIPCPPCDSLRVDTAEILRETTEVNRAHEKVLQNKLHDTEQQLTKTETELSYCMWAAMILGGYTLIRWLVRIIWGFKIP